MVMIPFNSTQHLQSVAANQLAPGVGLLGRGLSGELQETTSAWRREAGSPHSQENSLLIRMYFNRHGGSQANILRQISNRGLVHPLTRTGREQAAVSAAFREFDCGVAEGRADETGWQMWQAVFDDWTVHRRWERRIEGGESFYERPGALRTVHRRACD